MIRILLVAAGTLLSTIAWATSAVDQGIWEFSKTDNTNVTVIVQVDLTTQGIMKANVLCRDNYTGEEVRPSTQGAVTLTNTQIINPVGAEHKLPFKDHYCFAALPQGRIMTVTVIDANHVLVSGDPFFPNNTVWTRVGP